MFRVGQKVVCVDDMGHGRYSPFATCNFDLEGLRKGEVYTIRDIGRALGVDVVRLEEIHRSYSSFVGDENFYAGQRFRPIVERQTDISIFTKMLTDKPDN